MYNCILYLELLGEDEARGQIETLQLVMLGLINKFNDIFSGEFCKTAYFIIMFINSYLMFCFITITFVNVV